MISIVRRIFQIHSSIFSRLNTYEYVNMCSHALNCQIGIQIHELFCMLTNTPKINIKKMIKKWANTNRESMGVLCTSHLCRPRFMLHMFMCTRFSFHKKMEKFDEMGKHELKWEGKEIFVLTETTYVHTIFSVLSIFIIKRNSHSWDYALGKWWWWWRWSYHALS